MIVRWRGCSIDVVCRESDDATLQIKRDKSYANNIFKKQKERVVP